MSNDSLRAQGVANYKRFIDSALEEAECIIIVGSKNKYLESEWVRYEWDTYLGEVLTGRKRENIFTLRLEDMQIADLPISLRKYQSFSLDEIEQLYTFVQKRVSIHINTHLQFLYPAIFSKKQDGYDVVFPDLGIKTDGGNLSDAYIRAKDLLYVYFRYAFKYKTDCNTPTKLEDILQQYPSEIILFVDAIININ